MEIPKKENIKHHYAGTFLITPSGQIVGQQRDDKPNIDNPGKFAAFGGAVEVGETILGALMLELVDEETNLKIDLSDIHHLMDDISYRELAKEWEVRHFYFVTIKDEDLLNLKVYEGQGWVYITGPEDKNIIDSWKPVVTELVNRLSVKT